MSEKPYIQSVHGLAAYGILLDPVTGKVYNTSTPGWETWTDANVASYAAATLAEQGSSGIYALTLVPGGLSASQIYNGFLRYSPGGTVAPALSDPILPGINTPVILAWNGSAWQIAPVYRATLDPADVAGTPTGAVSGTPGSTSFQATGTLSSIGSAYANSYLRFEAGSANAGLALPITSYNGSTNTFGFAVAWPTTPLVGDRFVILGSHVP